MQELKHQAIEEFKKILDHDVFDINDYIKYGTYNTLKAVYDKLIYLQSMGIFKDKGMPFDPDKQIWRYDMSRLYTEEQGYLVELAMEDIFIEAIKGGFKNEVDTFIVVDESQKFIDASSVDHIVSVIGREGRKFGLGIILATQNCANFPEDILINSATKMVLGIDETYLLGVSKKLGVDPNRIRFTQPRKSAMVQVKTHKLIAESGFVDILFHN